MEFLKFLKYYLVVMMVSVALSAIIVSLYHISNPAADDAKLVGVFFAVWAFVAAFIMALFWIALLLIRSDSTFQ